MESPHDFGAVHGDHERLAVPRQKESADKSDALQTLRAVRRRPAVAKRLECARLKRCFLKAGSDSMAGSVHGKHHEASRGQRRAGETSALLSGSKRVSNATHDQKTFG